MDKNLINEIAQAIVNESILQNWLFYLVLIFISLASGAIGAFGSSYLKKLGENKAIKDGFKDILEQLKQTTETTEQIKHDFAAKFSDEAEHKKLMREKLEEIFTEISKCEPWLVENVTTTCKNGEYPRKEDSSLFSIKMLQQLYFRKCNLEFNLFKDAFNAAYLNLLNIASDKNKSRNTGLKYKIDVEETGKINNELFSQINNYQAALLKNYRKYINVSNDSIEEEELDK